MLIDSHLPQANPFSLVPTFNPNTITSIHLQCIQASRPHLADKTTSHTNKPYNHTDKPYCMYQSSPYPPPCCIPIPIYEINIQKDWHWPPNFFKIIRYIQTETKYMSSQIHVVSKITPSVQY